jgi:hypothetical protein
LPVFIQSHILFKGNGVCHLADTREPPEVSVLITPAGTIVAGGVIFMLNFYLNSTKGN